MDDVETFEADRARLVRLAAGILGDRAEADDAVQEGWLRFARAEGIENPPGWLTTVVTRICLDRLRARVPTPVDDAGWDEGGEAADPAESIELSEAVGVALHVVLDRLTPSERVAFILHDTFGFEFGMIADTLGCSPAAARQLGSRARRKVRSLSPAGKVADWQVVDAFLAAARNADFPRLLHLLAPDVVVSADSFARDLGTPATMQGREEVAQFFDGAAKAAMPVFVSGHAGAAWFLRGQPKVAFDFQVSDGLIRAIAFRADPETLNTLVRRVEGDSVTSGDARPSSPVEPQCEENP